jgi:cytoskeletal protein RodZ
MSDETPTQRFDQPPTTPLPAAGATGPTPTPEEKKSRALLIALIVVGAVLLAAIIVVLVLLLGRHGTPNALPTKTATASSTPTPTPTHTPTPTPTPTPTSSHTVAPPPPSTNPTVASFTVSNTKVTCPADTTQPDPTLTFSWTSTNASEAYFGVDTNDAKANPFFSNLPPNGNTTNFPSGYNPFDYPCPAASHVYTISVVGNGMQANKSVTITNVGQH